MCGRALWLCLTLASCVSLAELPPPKALPAGISFEGNWESSFGAMRLDQRERWVVGTYGKNGGLFGEAQGNQLRFNWRNHATGEWGKGYFVLAHDGKRMDGQRGKKRNEVGEGACWARRGQTSVAATEVPTSKGPP